MAINHSQTKSQMRIRNELTDFSGSLTRQGGGVIKRGKFSLTHTKSEDS